MPFTISHAVIAPPIAYLTGYRLPIGAIAIGAMTPDLYRLFTSENYMITHEWQGIIVPDLIIGLLFCLLWYSLFRPVVLRFIGMEKPLNLYNTDRVYGFILSVCIALIVGISTHIVWDGLTHFDYRTFAFKDFLSQSISIFGHAFHIHRVLQIGTSILALPLLLWMMIHHIRKHQQDIPVPRKIKQFAFWLFTLATFAGLVSFIQFARALGLELWFTDLYSFTGKAINYFSSTWLIVFSLGCIIFFILDWRKYFED